MRGLHPQGHVTRQYRGHVTNKKHLHFHKAYGPQTKEGGGLGWENPIQSREKSKALCFHFHKVYGSQT